MEKFRKSVFVVTYAFSKGKIFYLLLERKKHWHGWEFVKGGVEQNESSLDAVKREVYEETGQKALKVKTFNVSGKYRYRKVLIDRPGFIGQSYQLFSAEVKIGKVRIDKLEHGRYKWVGYDKAYTLLTHKNQKECLKTVNSYILDEVKK